MSLTNNTSELTNISGQISAIKNEYISQTKLISQIKEVLQEKASGELPENKLAQLADGSLREITASDLQGATKIRDYAFYYGTITSIDIPNSVTSIGIYAFKDCRSLTSVVIPASVASIGNYAFSTCQGLTSVEIPDSVASIGTQAFYGCVNLTSVVIGNSVTSIGGQAFQNCTKLTSVTIPNSVTSIDRYVFQSCKALTSITIPNSVTSIGSKALQIGSSSNKATITFLSTTPPSIQSDTFIAGLLQNIIVPKGYGDTYKNATNWSRFADYIIESET